MGSEAVAGKVVAPLVRQSLFEKEVPASWENVRQIFLRRERFQELASIWVAQGAQDAELPEVAQGLTGAYVRIYTVDGKNSDEGDIRGKYHLLQVQNTELSDGVITLKLECLRGPVRPELLSNGLPTGDELAVLQERISRRKLGVLSEGCLRDTLTRLALLFHAQLLPCQKLAGAPGGAEAAMAALRQELKATVREQRRRVLLEASAKSNEDGAKKVHGKRKTGAKETAETLASILASRAVDRPLRAVRLGKDPSTDGYGTSDAADVAAAETGEARKPTEADILNAPWTERQPLQRYMKVRKMVSLAELMRKAPQAPPTPERAVMKAAMQADMPPSAKKSLDE